MIGLTRHPGEQGGGASVSRYWRTGSGDDKKVPQLAEVDLEPYCGAEREEVRVTVQK